MIVQSSEIHRGFSDGREDRECVQRSSTACAGLPKPRGGPQGVAQTMIPLRDDNPTRTTPIVTHVIVALNVLAFLWELGSGDQLPRTFFELGFVPQRLTLALHGGTALPPTIATLLSSMFLHGGWLHLLGNMWYLWIFGDNVEDVLGHGPYALFYVAGGLCAAGLQYATHPTSMVPMVGASGAIAAVLGAYALAFPRARVVTLIPVFFFARITSLPALFVLGLWFVFQAFSGAMTVGAAGGGTAWWAHIGGFGFGLGAMWLAMQRRRAGPRPF